MNSPPGGIVEDIAHLGEKSIKLQKKKKKKKKKNFNISLSAENSGHN